MAALNLDRGVTTRFHPSGMKIAQYDDTPGIYYTEGGDPIDPKFAREAGFDVERDTRQRLKNERLNEYKRKLDEEMKSEEDALAQVLSDRSAYDVRHIGAGQYAIFDKSGKRITRVGMTKQDVELFVGVVPHDPNDPTASPSA